MSDEKKRTASSEGGATEYIGSATYLRWTESD